MSFASTLVLVLALASPDSPDATTIDAALIRGEGVDLPEIERALRVRLPSLQLFEQGMDMPEGTGMRAFVDLRRLSPTQVQVAVILSDGRAYFRTVDIEAGEPARPVAGALALLIAAIEDDSVAPDQRDVPVPPAIAAPVESHVLEARECPAPAPCPKPPAPVEPPPPPRLELAPTLRSGATFGLGPQVPGLRGAMFGFGVDLRWRGGATLAVDLRAIGARVERYPLHRVRVAAGGGYTLRRGAFELPIVGMFGVEWWGVRGDSELDRHGPGAAARPLVGGGLRLSPGFWARLGPAALRAGARVELWGSGEPGPGGLRQPVIARVNEPGLAALGGAELSLALELSVWLAPRRAKRTGPKRQ